MIIVVQILGKRTRREPAWKIVGLPQFEPVYVKECPSRKLASVAPPKLTCTSQPTRAVHVELARLRENAFRSLRNAEILPARACCQADEGAIQSLGDTLAAEGRLPVTSCSLNRLYRIVNVNAIEIELITSVLPIV